MPLETSTRKSGLDILDSFFSESKSDDKKLTAEEDINYESEAKSGLDLLDSFFEGSTVEDVKSRLELQDFTSAEDTKGIIDTKADKSSMRLSETSYSPYSPEGVFASVFPGVSKEEGPAEEKEITQPHKTGLALLHETEGVYNPPTERGIYTLEGSISGPVERFLGGVTEKIFGYNAFEKITPAAAAQAFMQLRAKDAGMSLKEYKNTVSPQMLAVEEAAGAFVNAVTLGFGYTLKEALTGEQYVEPSHPADQIGTAVGELAGFIAGPIKIGEKLLKPVFKYIPTAAQSGRLAERILKTSLRDALLIGTASSIRSTGEVAGQTTFTQAADVLWNNFKSGAMVGGIFGVVKGMFPKEGAQTAARMLTGLIGLNAYRAKQIGGNPFTDRPLELVAFDTLMDVFFLYRGLPKDARTRLPKDLEDLAKRMEEVDKIREALPKLESEEGVPPEVLKKARERVAEVDRMQKELEEKLEAIKAKAKTDIESKLEGEAKAKEIQAIKDGKIVEPLNELKKTEVEKAPWKKTKDEYIADEETRAAEEDMRLDFIEQEVARGKSLEDIAGRLGEPVEDVSRSYKEFIEGGRKSAKSLNLESSYEAAIRQAFMSGEKIPGKILAQFPDLKKAVREGKKVKKQEPKTPPVEETKQPQKEAEAKPAEAEIEKEIEEFKAELPKSPKTYPSQVKTMEAKGEAIVKSDKYRKKAPAEPKKSTKRKLKTAEPANDIDLETGEPLPEKLSTDKHPLRNKDVKNTNEIRAVLQERVNAVDISPEVFTRYLINEVNRYLNGEKVDIDKVRFGLSELAARAGNLRMKFDKQEDFLFWKSFVSDAASWARKAERSTIKRTGGTTLTMRIDPTNIKRFFKGFHGTSSKYINPKDIVGKQLEPKTLKQIVEDTLNELKLTGNERTKAREQIYAYEYFDYSIKEGEGSRPFDKGGEVYAAKDFESAAEYAEWAGEAYDNALIALGAFDEKPTGLAKKAKDIYDKNREATPYVLEVAFDKPLKEGDNITSNPIKVTGVFDQGGTKLYSGIDPTEGVKQIVNGAKALAAYTAKARGMKKWKPKEAAKMLRENAVKYFIDRSGNIRRDLLEELQDEGYNIVQALYLTKGSTSLASEYLVQMRKEVYEGLSKEDKKILDNIILASRILDIAKYKTPSQFAYPEGITPTECAAYYELFPYIENISPGKAEKLLQRADAYFKWMKKPLEDMLEAELITQEEYDSLVSHNYRRLKLVEALDKRYSAKVGGRKVTVYDSGIEALSHGRGTDVFEPSSEVMALEVFNRAYGRILNNAANRTLLDLARNNKDNPFVAVKESPSDHIPSGWQRIFVYTGGQRQALYLSPKMAGEWITNNREMSYVMGQFLRYASMSPVLRTFATGINWGFALANLPRDAMHIWYAARYFENGKWKSAYSPHLPVYQAQMTADIARVAKDAITKTGRYIDYIKEGGGMEFLVLQGRIMQRGRHIEGELDKAQDLLGYPGEVSEILTRLAVRDRVIMKRAKQLGISYEEAYKNKKITREATFVARDYMDFGQGGTITKALDNATPYLNAGVQGTRGLLRAFKDNPLVSTYKLMQFAALVTGLYIANQKRCPETMKALKGNINMQNNLIIPIGDEFGFYDKTGQKRYPFVKVPLDPGQRFFKIFFEASYDKLTGKEVDVKGVVNSFKQISPIDTSMLPPSVSATLGYIQNRDFWANENIWKRSKPIEWPRSNVEVVPGVTPQAMIDIGNLTGLSPERLRYSLEELVTSGSQWSWLAGQGYDLMFKDTSQDVKSLYVANMWEKSADYPIVNRFVGLTNPVTQYIQNIERHEEDAAIEKLKLDTGLKMKVDAYLYEGGKRSDVLNYIKENAKDYATFERLRDNFEFQEKIKNLENRSFWILMKNVPDTEARAKIFVDRYWPATEKEKEAIRKEMAIVELAGGIISDPFKEAVGRLINERSMEAEQIVED